MTPKTPAGGPVEAKRQVLKQGHQSVLWDGMLLASEGCWCTRWLLGFLVSWGEGSWGKAVRPGLRMPPVSLPACRCRERARWLPCRSTEAAGGASGFPPRASCCPGEQPVTGGRRGVRGASTVLLPQLGTPHGAAMKGSASYLLPGHIICLLFLFHSHIPLLITTTHAIQKKVRMLKSPHT